MLPHVLRVIASLALLAILAACAAVVSPGSAPALASPTAPASLTPVPATNTPAPSPAPATNTPPPSATLGAAGGPSMTPQYTSASATPDPRATPAVTAARTMLVKQLNIPDSQVTLVSAARVEWPDACLGAAKAGEMCAQMVTPGYRIIFSTPQGTYEMHTDALGRAVRMAPPSGLVPVTPPAVPTSSAGAVGPAEQPAVQAARAALAAWLKVPAAQLQLQSVEAAEWGSSCLGAARPRENCLAVITPGYRIIFTNQAVPYEVHTNRDGSAVRVVGA